MQYPEKNLAIYIHWPFCKHKCPYCDFNSHVREQIDQQQWNQAYLSQINRYAEILKNKKIISIFFGGGTPSLMPSFIIANIINELYKLSHFSDQIEITLEANPTSVESTKFKAFKQAGVNRLSLGIQSLNLNNLKFLGREHNVKEAVEAIELARETFDRYSFDLIYALPTQTLSAWEKELTEALKFADKHLSLYQLTIEKGTAFYKMYQNKAFKLPNEDLAKDFYLLTQNIMESHNLPAYEISNHAALENECKHNLVYWQYGDFLGIGPGAHSRVNNQAITAVYNPEIWLKKSLDNQPSIQNSITLSLQEKIEEILLMGLRLTNGLNMETFYNKTRLYLSDAVNKKKLDFLIQNRFLEMNQSHLITTLEGRLVLNQIIEQLTQHY